MLVFGVPAQLGRAQQVPDVIRAKRRRGSNQGGSSFPIAVQGTAHFTYWRPTPHPKTAPFLSVYRPSLIESCPDVVLSQRRRRGSRAGHVLQLGELHIVLEAFVIGIAVQHRGHPPGEALRLPGAPQAGVRVVLQQVGLALLVPCLEGFDEGPYVADGEVHPLGTGRRHDVRRVPGEVEPTVLHRLDDEAAHPDDALLEDRPFVERPAIVGLGPRLELLPDLLVGPVLGVVLRVELEVHALDLRRTRADQGKAAFVERIDQLLRRSGRLGEDAEPAEGVLPLVLGTRSLRDGRPAHPMVTVAARHEVAPQLMVLTVLPIADGRLLRLEIMQAYGFGLEQNLRVCVEPGADEVLDDLMLAIQHDTPAGEVAQWDTVSLPVESQLDALMYRPLPVHTLANTRLPQQVDRALLEHARPDLRLQPLAAAKLYYHRLDAPQVQKVREYQPRRSTSDDAYLCTHASCSSFSTTIVRSTIGAIRSISSSPRTRIPT